MTWFDLPTPVVIAHRGDSMHAPENTLAAFRLAAENGADAIEFDVKLTADGEVIALHDRTLDRTTDGHGEVHRFTLAALQELDAGSWFDERYRGERIPTLSQIFETVGKRLYMNIELTNYATPNDNLVARVVELVKRHGMQERVLFSSFLARNLRRAKRLLPEVPCAQLALPGWMGWPARTFGWRAQVEALHPHLKDASSALIARLHRVGKRVQVWTVNEETEMRLLIERGVDGLFTDDPLRLCRVLGRSS
ncbi:MAG: glycerophosphodiester phosphodiesterase family protein [Anaerolineales bacterium]|nr:glycerophosphodiester phosphodiesterase family protein [Anaerolineales bacterium]